MKFKRFLNTLRSKRRENEALAALDPSVAGGFDARPGQEAPCADGFPECDTGAEAYLYVFVFRLRALLRLKWRTSLSNVLEDDVPGLVGKFLGVREIVGQPPGSEQELRQWLESLLAHYESQAALLDDRGSTGFDTLDVLLRMVGLNEPRHVAVARYVGIVMQDDDLCRMLDEWRSNPSYSDHLEVMARLTSGDRAQVSEAVRELTQAGILHSGGGSFYGLLAARETGIRFTKPVQHMMMLNIQGADELVERLCGGLTPQGEVALEDFPHLQDAIDLALRLFRDAHAQGTACHVLLVGPPGTGKTSLAHALARHLECRLIPVSVEDEDGDPMSDQNRLSDYRLKQALFKKRQAQAGALLMFDKVDQVLGGGWPAGWLNPRQDSAKARINQLMDQATCPTVWITNSLLGWDTAYLRRFHFIMEVTIPPLSLRKAQIRQMRPSLGLPESLIEALAERQLPVALLRQTLERVSETKAEEEIRLVVNGYLKALGRPMLRRRRDKGLPPFDAKYLNISVPPERLFRAMAQESTLRVLFDGPPGTGKTELARQLAASADAELLSIRASDLLSKYVGETEQNIASWFARAAAHQAVLLIDEADSFLRSREAARHGWEVTQVNELLVQIEAYEGVLILGTNYGESLDDAVARRLDFKVRFHPLDGAGRVAFFRAVLEHNGAVSLALPKEQEAVLRGMDRLTIGDFAPAIQCLKASGEDITPDTLLRELVAEYRVRHRQGTIGFVRPAI